MRRARACACLLLLLLTTQPLHAAGRTSLLRVAFWTDRADAALEDGVLRIDGTGDLLVDPYGAQLNVAGNFELSATLQANTVALAAVAVVDDAGSQLEFGLAGGQAVFNGAAYNTDAPLGPLTLQLTRLGNQLAFAVSGAELARVEYPFSGSRLSLGTHVSMGNQLSVYALDVDGSVSVDRCAPDRVLIAGADAPDAPSALWWLAPDDGQLRRIDTGGQRLFLTAVSPDHRWLSYYQRSPAAPGDRFVVDTWVMNLATEERVKLVDGGTPLAWTADSRGVVLGEHPDLTALVPSGEQVPTDAPLVQSDSLRGLNSPNGALRAAVASTPNGAAGIELLDRASGDLVLEVPTGRGAVQLAWSPDSSRLAYTNGVDSPDGLIWRLRMVDVTERRVTVPESTRDMELHSVVWVPALPGCN